ncbi:hypothetical protein ACFLXG_04085 [Chloroflexota bacterium]
MKKRSKIFMSLMLALVISLSTFTIALAASISNGNFETGNLNGWQRTQSGYGQWVAYSGTSLPMSMYVGSFYAPPEGSNAAATSQTGPSMQILYQDLVLEPEYYHELSFWLYYENYGGIFYTPNTLLTNTLNQQYRIDLVDPNAPITSVSPGDVLATLFRTEVGDPPSMAPTKVTFNLDSYAGQTVRLRFAVTDTLYYFAGAVDDVQIESELINLPPDTSGAYADKDCIWPPNHKMVDVGIEGVTDPDGDPITLTIVSITSDEPVNDSGDGNQTPDADGIGTDVATVRAERSGNGDGRVYVVSFIAEDGNGGVSEGSVAIGVPHDKSGKDCSAVDSGQDYDATQSDDQFTP